MDDKTVSLLGNGLKILIAALGIIVLFVVFFTLDTKEPENTSGITGSILLAYVVTGICAVLALVFGIYQFATGGTKAAWIGLGGFVVILLIAYLISSGDVPKHLETAVDGGTYKMIGGGILAFYIFTALAVIAIVYSELSTLFKK